MHYFSRIYRLRLSSKLFLANVLTSLALLLIAGFIVYSFNSVRNESIDITKTDINNVIRNAGVTRDLSTLFSDIDLLDRTSYGDAEYQETEGGRLVKEIENIKYSSIDQKLHEIILALSDQFNLYLSYSAIVNDALQMTELIEEEIHAELAKLETLISDWLIKSTLEGEDTDYVTQQLTLVMGYHESILNTEKLYAEVDFGSVDSLSIKHSPVIKAIDDLTLRLETITASIPEVARRGETIKEKVLKYRNNIERVYEESARLNTLRADLKVSKDSALLAMEKIDEDIAVSSLLTARKVEEIVTFSGNTVVLWTLVVIAFIFFTTVQLIKFNIKNPMRVILDGIDSFSKGNFDRKIELEREDEWDIIGRSLNGMATELDKSRDELKEAYEELERRVEDRTKELAKTVKALANSEASHKEAQRIAHLAHWSWDIRTGNNVWSEEQYRIYGLEPFEVDVTNEVFVGFLHPDDSDRVLTALSEAVEQQKAYTAEYRIVRRDGTIRWIEAQGHVRRSDDGEPIEMTGTVLDITERKRIERLLLEEKERALVTLHSIGDAVISTDAHGNIEYLNPVAETLTGYKIDEARGQELDQVFRIINEETGEAAEDPVERCLTEGKIVGLGNHSILVSRSGTEYAIQDSAAPIADSTGEVMGVVLVFSDVTQARRLSRQISYEAAHDGLTGLANRKEFERRLDRVVGTARAESTDNALCYMDLDQFKLINDTCGHVAGDEVLRQVSNLLRNNVRHRDTLARLGGDEFGLLMEHCSLEEAKQNAGKLIEAISNYVFLWEDKRFMIGVSIGLVAVDDSSTDIGSLLSAADTACFMAKEQGRNRLHVFQEHDEHLAQRHGEMQWAVRLPRALEEGNFQLYFQPLAPAASKGVKGAHYEVLIRLEEDHIVLPEAFMPAAERYQLSSQLDRWVIATTFQWIADHPAHLRDLYLCAINLSGHSLNEEAFLEFLTHRLKHSPIPAGKICFEITETVAIANISRATNFMKHLKDQGCRFALDDFGSGLSSFAYLKSLPVDFLKIDGVFVKDILDNSLNLALVKAINEVGQVMGVKTIAEYVESEAILKKVREIGVDYAQGFGIDRPRPIEELLN
jgi:diguanylate cyclase (GGDEF)-like protein/PAS domain S-box-containing protein